jgi:hypothetical protein
MTTTLLRHEWLRTRGMLLTIAALALAVSVLGSGLAALRVPLVSQTTGLLSLVAIIVLVPVVQVALTVDYWRSSYGRIGYFTQTLPIPGQVIFRAKLLWSWIATAGSLVVAVALAIIAWPGVARGLGLGPVNPIAAVGDLFASVTQYMSMWQYLALIVVGLAVAVFNWPVQYYAAATIGSEEPRNRFGGGGVVIAWVVLYVITQAVALLAIIAIPFGIGLTDAGGVGLVGFSPVQDLFGGGSSDIVPIGFVPAILLVSAVLLWRTARSWRRGVSLV